MAVYIVGGILVTGLLAVTYWMFWAGLAGTAGLVRLRRCHSCGHLIPTSHPAVSACPYCRHPRVARHLVHHRLNHYLPGDW
jgi:hypothetical protein